MITGAHAIIFSKDADAVRAFVRDVLEFPSVDAGNGWLIFALPPAELALHPAVDAGHHELYLMCDDIHATVAELEGKGVAFVDYTEGPLTTTGHIAQLGPARAAWFRDPDGNFLGLRQS